MDIVIVGGGKIGITLVEQLSNEGHDITLIDKNQARINNCVNKFDILGICGNGASHEVQQEAHVNNADIFIAATSSDELNILCCLIAKKSGARRTMARVRNPEYTEQFTFFRSELGVNMIFNPEYEAAKEITKILQFPNAIDIESFAKGAVDLIEIKIDEGSPLCDVALQDLPHKFKAKVMVCAVQRDSDVIIPRGDFVLKQGDRIHITSYQSEMVKLAKQLGLNKFKNKNIMIIGGGKIGYYLAKSLSEYGGYNIKIIEISKERCEFLATQLPDVKIINANGNDSDVLLEQRIEDVDTVVALSTIDEENVITSLYASSLGIHKTIAKVNHIPDKIINRLGVDSAFSSRGIASDLIVGYIRALGASGDSEIKTLYKLVGGQVEALEFRISDAFKFAGVPIKDLNIHMDTLIVSIVRDGRVMFPSAEDSINVGDNVIIVSKKGQFKSINEIFK